MTIKQWEVTVSLTQTLLFPVEDDEDEKGFREWLRSDDGHNGVFDDFSDNLRFGRRVAKSNTHIDIIDLSLKETKEGK